MGNWEPALPMDVWSNIEGAIASNSKRRGFIWWFSGAAVAALTLVTIYTAINKNEVNVNVIRPAETVKAENGVKNMPSVSAIDERNTSIAENTITKNNTTSGSNTSLKNTNAENAVQYNPLPLNNNTIGIASYKNNNAQSNNLEQWLIDMPIFGKLSNTTQGIEPFTETAIPQNLFTEMPAVLTIYSENAFGLADNAGTVKAKNNNPNSFFWRANIAQIQSNLSYSSTNNVFVHRDFNSLQKNNNKTIGSLELELTAGKHLGNNWFATASMRVGQQGSQANYNFTLVPVGTDNTVNTDKFGYFPIVAYFDAFASKVQLNTRQLTTVAEIPIGIEKQWNVLNNKFKINAGLNAAAGMAINKVGTTLNYNDLSVVNVNTDWYRNVMFSNGANVGISRNTKLGSVGINIKGKVYPGNVYKVGSSVKQKPYELGLGLIWTGGLTK